jgi:peptide/nickel transport system permease protein
VKEKKISAILRKPAVKFLLRKVIFLFATFYVYVTIIFVLPRVIPGNPLATLLAQILQTMQVTPELVTAVQKRLMEEFGLHKPLHEQYLDFLMRIFKGDLGTSYSLFPRKVTELVFAYLPWTLGLLIPATVASWMLGNLLGAIAGYKRGGKLDNVILPISIVFSQTPYYWLAMLLLFIFGVTFRWFPLGGAYSYGMTPSLSLEFIFSYLHHYVLPFLSIVLAAIGGWAIGMRVLVIYELRTDYIDFADTLGLNEDKLLRYAFKNSILPQITGLALNLGTILGGSLITEIVFSYPGTGYLIFQAITRLDYPLIQGTFVILFSTLILANFIVDIIYAFLDPRIRTGYIGE